MTDLTEESEAAEPEFDAIRNLTILFDTLSPEDRGKVFTKLAHRFLVDLGASAVEVTDRSVPVCVAMGRNEMAEPIRLAYEKVKSLVYGGKSVQQTTLFFAVGQQVEVTVGYFKGLRGVVKGMLNAQSVLVRMNNKSRPMGFNIEHVKVVP